MLAVTHEFQSGSKDQWRFSLDLIELTRLDANDEESSSNTYRMSFDLREKERASKLINIVNRLGKRPDISSDISQISFSSSLLADLFRLGYVKRKRCSKHIRGKNSLPCRTIF